MKILTLLLLLAAAPALAGPFDKGDIKEGKATHEAKCNGCHAGKFNGDGSKIYTRADRRVKTASGLSQMITGKLRRDFKFADHYITMTFVNAVAWVSHQQGHHPDLAVGWNTCRVEYITHAINGLSESDFICAAKIDALFDI